MKLHNLKCPECGDRLLIDYRLGHMIREPSGAFICINCEREFLLGIRNGLFYIDRIVRVNNCPLCGGQLKGHKELYECESCLQQFALDGNRLYVMPERRLLHAMDEEVLVQLQSARELFERLNTISTRNFLKRHFRGYRIDYTSMPTVLAMLCLAAKKVPITINTLECVLGRKVGWDVLHRLGDKGLLSVDVRHKFYIWYVKGKFLQLAIRLAKEVAEAREDE